MRHYTADEEERIRLQTSVREWARAGLLTGQQAATLDEKLRTDLKRTNMLLRAALAAFTALIVGASIGLVAVGFNIHRDLAVAILLGVSSLVCFALADYLVGSIRVYRYGVEEALATLSAVLLAFATMMFVNSGGRTGGGHLDVIAALLACAAAAFVVYRRFGFVYAGIGGMICAGVLPFQFDWPSSAERICAVAAFGAMFFVARALYRNHGDDFPGDEYAWFEAAACAAVYLSLNLHLFGVLDGFVRVTATTVEPWFYRTTYAAVWLIPAAALVDAIRAKDRALLTVAIPLALATLATNKPYLGVPRQSWDPMLLGVLLIGVSVALRRWLASGPGSARNGYTPDRILEADRDLLTTAANVSFAWHQRAQQPVPADPPPTSFEGGRSGGGGGGASY